MLTTKIQKALNAQINLEAQASSQYLAMASWCDQEGMNGCAAFMYAQSEEEREHMLKILHYINDSDGSAVVPATKKPALSFKSIEGLFKNVYQHEKKVTASINALVELASKENDHNSYNFLQWFVEEQREEEALMRGILDKIKLIGKGPQSKYYIDKEVGQIHAAEVEKAP